MVIVYDNTRQIYCTIHITMTIVCYSGYIKCCLRLWYVRHIYTVIQWKVLIGRICRDSFERGGKGGRQITERSSREVTLTRVGKVTMSHKSERDQLIVYDRGSWKVIYVLGYKRNDRVQICIYKCINCTASKVNIVKCVPTNLI